MKVRLQGFKELEEALVELETLTVKTTTGRNVLKRAGTQALEPLRQRMSQLAPYDPEDRDGNGQHLKDTIRTQAANAKQARRIGTDRRSGVVLLTGPAPVGRRMRSAAASLERGTGERFHKSGKSVGFLPAEPYVRPAADQTSGQVIDGMTDLIVEQIGKAKERIARKAARKAKG